MIFDFNAIFETASSNGMMTFKSLSENGITVTPCRIHPGGSTGMHRHESGADISYVLYGTGIAVCDGKEEFLSTDICHICPAGSEHNITNTGNADLVLLSVSLNY